MCKTKAYKPVKYLNYRSNVLIHTGDNTDFGKEILSNNKENLKRYVFVSVVDVMENSKTEIMYDRIQRIHDSILDDCEFIYPAKVITNGCDTDGDEINNNQVYYRIKSGKFENLGNKNTRYEELVKKYKIKSFKYSSFFEEFYEAADEDGWFYSNNGMDLRRFMFANNIWNYEQRHSEKCPNAQDIHDNIFKDSMYVEENTRVITSITLDGVYFRSYGKRFRRCDSKKAMYDEYVKKYNIKIR